MINFTAPRHHWNYYLALDKDLEKLSRYIEFSDANLLVYSVELTHILLTASSEVDVIMKQLCTLLDSSKDYSNINDYRSAIQDNCPNLINETIFINRFGLSFSPWENWSGNINPNWWTSHNHVKHQRNDYFREANLQNAINSVGALLVTTFYYYNNAFEAEAGHHVSMHDTIRNLQPSDTFVRIASQYYPQYLIT